MHPGCRRTAPAGRRRAKWSDRTGRDRRARLVKRREDRRAGGGKSCRSMARERTRSEFREGGNFNPEERIRRTPWRHRGRNGSWHILRLSDDCQI